MSRPLAYGIDFGTTNSAISVAYDDRAEVVQVAGRSYVPSIIYLDRTRQRLAGHDAVEQFAVAGDSGARLISSVKSALADPSMESGTEAPWGECLGLDDVVSIVLRLMKQEADSVVGADVRRVVLGHPVCFVGAEGPELEDRQELALGRLEAAARKAGFQEVEFLPEPTAALYPEHVPQGVMLSVDFGGGTFDASIVELQPDGGEVLAIQGAAIGGELFDSLLFDEKVAPELGLDSSYFINGKVLPVPAQLRQMNTLAGILRMVIDDRTYKAIEHLRGAPGGDRLRVIEDILFGGHGYAFYRSVEQAKIDLSSSEKSAVRFSRPGIRLEVPVRRAELDALLRRQLDVIDRVIDRAMEQAGLKPGDLDLIVRTGGSSKLRSFVERLLAKFPRDRVVERDAFTTVALGLGHHARAVWGPV